jgi:Rps23 Pro-64 3,4-dihydroxylase Tpa1-like proline 4-hydroxylase
VKSFYCQEILDLSTIEEQQLLWLVADSTKVRLAQQMSDLFSTPLDPNKTLVRAHRSTLGDFVNSHNDDPSGGTASHRLVITITDQHTSDSGGDLLLLWSNSTDGPSVRIPPTDGVGVAMEFSAKSWHAVKKVNSGIRYSIIYSFRS